MSSRRPNICGGSAKWEPEAQSARPPAVTTGPAHSRGRLLGYFWYHSRNGARWNANPDAAVSLAVLLCSGQLRLTVEKLVPLPALNTDPPTDRHTFSAGVFCCSGNDLHGMRTRGHKDTRTRGHKDTRTRGTGRTTRNPDRDRHRASARDRDLQFSFVSGDQKRDVF
ncbi:unnamed protein product [Pleuronectes platessa]|uniref:Uncharacterized protein n=1 Tax=Pleuronectes platessa TaxID=8262 RepID=A0A9N7TQN4_PLEPL|nr:unnamed protein product [Pleuronectes platessa]